MSRRFGRTALLLSTVLPLHLALSPVLLAGGTGLSVLLTASPSRAQDVTVPTPGDPPARVGRLARVIGTVSERLPGQDNWDAARVNLPVTTGSATWTAAGARALIEAGPQRWALDSQTELDITRLDEAATLATLPQGSAYLHLQALQPNEAVQLTTPRVLVSFTAPGRYLVVAGTETDPTRVVVYEGSATLSADGFAPVSLAAGQAATFTGTTPPTASYGPAGADTALVAWARSLEPHGALPRSAAAITGIADCATSGRWSRSPQYGDVWTPEVPQGWAPFRQGHWQEVQPWGWTWVDDQPWGFATSHYGRWVEVDDRWSWAPAPAVLVEQGPPPPPAYAPAVVSFFAGAALGAIAGAVIEDARRPPVGWIPLGPDEPYRPWYRASPTYLRQVNVTNVRNTTIINNITNNTNIQEIAPDRLVNRRAATLLPPAVAGQGAPGPRPVPVAALNEAQVLTRPPALPPRPATPPAPPPPQARWGLARAVERPSPEATPIRPVAVPQARPAGEARPEEVPPGRPGPEQAVPERPNPERPAPQGAFPGNVPRGEETPAPGMPMIPRSGQPTVGVPEQRPGVAARPPGQEGAGDAAPRGAPGAPPVGAPQRPEAAPSRPSSPLEAQRPPGEAAPAQRPEGVPAPVTPAIPARPAPAVPAPSRPATPAMPAPATSPSAVTPHGAPPDHAQRPAVPQNAAPHTLPREVPQPAPRPQQPRPEAAPPRAEPLAAPPVHAAPPRMPEPVRAPVAVPRPAPQPQAARPEFQRPEAPHGQPPHPVAAPHPAPRPAAEEERPRPPNH